MSASGDPGRVKPWYRHFWVWFLIAPPAATVLFWVGVLTTTAASPSLVVDDYSKIGLIYQKERQRDHAAADLGVTARLHVMRDDGAVTVALSGLQDYPRRLKVRLTHPTDAHQDLAITVDRTATGIYRGRLDKAVPDRRYVQVEPADDAWRLTGELLAHRADLDLAPDKRDREGDPLAAR